ncbi:MAG: valine--tRNA ligase [Candidatus Aenigmarchaeota archaeon]|nr:valine--tRNA ligase [Candidatus Aenigmarchaeota archaeon]
MPKTSKHLQAKQKVQKAAQQKPAQERRGYDAAAASKKWQSAWEKENIYAFNPKKGRIFSIDTPPPYPSGDFHMGNVLNWCYFDFAARYKRMQGFNVHFPQGWDVHGLPTESRVEQWKKKKSSEVPASQWVEWCNQWTNEHIKEMKAMIKALGISCDWSLEYRTSDPLYVKMVQLSFLQLAEKGLAYRGKHPINWCPSCRTAIADAEVEHKERDTKLYHIKFMLSGASAHSDAERRHATAPIDSGEGEIMIATTRPELLSACVGIAVHPEDERYKEIAGRRAIVPIFGQEVDIFTSPAVEREFGTGIVMICSFGDKQDVAWIMRHQLPIIEAIDERGNMTEAAGRFVGMTTTNAKREILTELSKKGHLLEEQTLKQNVGVCWRCKTIIEILNKEQWFLRATQLTNEVVEETNKVKWYPDHMKIRQIQWAKSMDWDWVVSRQKVYGTPIPVWYCRKCNNIIFPEEDELPVDPSAKKKECMRCKTIAVGEKDRFDTWIDSSMTTYWHAGWPDRSLHADSAAGWEKMIPADLQPNGTDIIRTWDYYLMLRSLMLTGKPAYKSVLINGMVLGEDGRKMSKSLGNYVTAKDALEENSIDAIRYWVTRGAVGSDLPFSWKDIQHGEKLFNKIYNIAQFCSLHLSEKPKISPNDLEMIDLWILTKLQKLIKNCTEMMENYQFSETVNAMENFIWHEFADYYLEIVKHRLYGDEKKASAQFCLYTCMLNSLKLLSPFAPHITEEVYQSLFKEHEKAESIHTQAWPQPDENLLNEEAEKLGEIANDVIATLRQWKMSKKMPLNAPLRLVTIENEDLAPLVDDIKGTLKIENLKIGRASHLTTEVFKIAIDVEV